MSKRHVPTANRALGQEGVEKRVQRERQSADRKVMYQEQARDRVALRQAHDAHKLEHQRWGRALYAAARERAFKEVKNLNANRWAEIRKLSDTKVREQEAQALRARQKEIYAEASARHVEVVRPAKDEAWQKLKLTQDEERQQLQRRHLDESATLSRAHIAERLSLHETWQQRHLKTGAHRVSASLESRQGMAAVQTTAVKMIKLRAKSADHPPDAPKMLAERARTEHATRSAIRYDLNAERQLNQMHTSSASTGQRPFRERLAEQRALDRDGKAPQPPLRRQSAPRPDTQPDTQSAIKQAAKSGAALSGADRANASPETKAEITAKDKKDKDSRQGSFQDFVAHQDDNGRTGGRSGR